MAFLLITSREAGRPAAYAPSRWGLLVFSLGLLACEHAPPAAVRSAAAPQWPAHRLGESDFSLALPATHALAAVGAPTFVTYNFAPVDTLTAADFTGGVCFNCYMRPGSDSAHATGCPGRRWPATVLGQRLAFGVRYCGGRYLLTGHLGSPATGQAPPEQLYLFGEARSETGLRRLVAVFTTLRRSAQPQAVPASP